MYKGDYFLIALIFVLIGLLAVEYGLGYQKDCNNQKAIARLHEEVLEQKKEIDRLENELGIVQRDFAMSGIYDRRRKK